MLNETSFKLFNIYSAVKAIELHIYCNTSYSISGVNQMWILKTSKDLLEYIEARSCPPPRAIALNIRPLYPSTQLFPNELNCSS